MERNANNLATGTIRKKRDVALDFMKVFATLLVINSHMKTLYGSYSALSAGGAIGDALFFFISGYTLFLGSKMNFVNWYKRRIGRIYPTVIAMGLFASLVFGQDFSFVEIMGVSRYWFLKCILVCYLLLYPVIRYEWRLNRCIAISIVVMIGSYFFFDFGGRMFYGVNNHFRWIVFFSVMLVGGGIKGYSHKMVYHWWALPMTLLCAIAWYGVTSITRGSVLQLLSYIPLIGVCLSLYMVGKAPWVEKMFETRVWGNILFIIGNLCLESYLIQRYIFTDALNGIFPLNIPVIMIAVLVASYLLHVFSGIISQTFDSKPFNYHSLILYKK